MTHPQDTTSEVVAPSPSSDAGEVVEAARYRVNNPSAWPDGYDDAISEEIRALITQLEAVERERDEARDSLGAAWAKHGGMEMAKGQWEYRATTAETQLAALTKRVGELEGALERKQDMLETLVSFVHRWTWEKEGNGTTDAERLDVIKHYPPIAARRLTGEEAKP